MFNNFEKLVKAHNVKYSDVAKGAGISYSTITDWKAGRYTPKHDKLQKIADYFGVSIDYFETGEEHTAEQVINTAFNSLETERTLNDSFFEDIQKDPVFMQYIKFLWSLDDNVKQFIYDTISTQYHKKEQAHREKDA